MLFVILIVITVKAFLSGGRGWSLADLVVRVLWLDMSVLISV